MQAKKYLRDKPSVKSTRASQAAGSSGGRAWNPSGLAGKKSVLEGDFYSKRSVEAAEESSMSDSDTQSLEDMDDLDAEILGIPKPASGPRKSPMEGPGKCDSSRGAVKTTGKLPTPGKEPPQTPLCTTAPVQTRKEFTFEDDDDDEDELLAALGFRRDRKKEELQPLYSKLDELFGRGSAAKVSEKPGTAERKEFKPDEKSQKQPEEEDDWDKEDLIFGEYRPSMGFRSSGRQSVRFTAKNTGEPKTEPRSKPSPPASLNPVQHRGSGADWLGLKDEVFFDSEPPSPVKTSTAGVSPSPASQLPAAEEAAAKTGPQEEEKDWLTAVLVRKKAQAQAKAEEREAKPLQAAGEGPGPRSPVSQTAPSPAAAQQAAAPQDTAAQAAAPQDTAAQAAAPQDTAAQAAAPQDKAASTDGSRRPVPWLSTVKPASANLSETAKEDPSGDANAMVPTASLPGEKEIPGPAPLIQAEAPALDVLPEKRLGAPAAQLSEETSGCRAELLSVKVRVVELEGKVRMLEMLLAESKLMLESVQQQHREDLDLLKSSHRTSVKLLEESYKRQEEAHRQREETLRWQKEQLLAHMEQQRQDAKQQQAELQQQHQLMLENLREMQRASVLKMRKDQEEQLQRLKRLKEQEMNAVTSAVSHTRSQNGVTDPHDLSCKAEATRHSTSQELATEVQRWDKQLRMLQDRLSQHQKDMEEERRRLWEQVAKTEARLDEQTRLLEQERAELKISRQQLKAKEEQLEKDREKLDKAWKELRMEKEKVNDAVLRVQKQEEEVENRNRLLTQRIAEARSIDLEHQARLRDVLQDLQQLKQQRQQRQQQEQQRQQQQQQQQRLHQESEEQPSTAFSRGQPEHEELLRHRMTSLTAAQDLGAPSNGLSSTMDLPPVVETPPRHRIRDIGEIMAAAERALRSAQMEALRFHIGKEKYALEDEKLFLESMKKAP